MSQFKNLFKKLVFARDQTMESITIDLHTQRFKQRAIDYIVENCLIVVNKRLDILSVVMIKTLINVMSYTYVYVFKYNLFIFASIQICKQIKFTWF